MFTLLTCISMALAGPTHTLPVSNRSYLRWAERLEAAELGAHPESGYRFYGELHAELADVVREWPGVVQPEEIGRTLENRPIWAFHIENHRVPVENRVLITAQIHALEWVGAEVAVDLIGDLAGAPEPGVRVTVVPVINIDGRMRVESDLREGRNLYRRGNAQKVDLNRDFGEKRDAVAPWRHIIPNYYATSPAPLSQPESQAIAALADREKYQRALSLHAAGGFIYYPWGAIWDRPEDWEELEALARQMQSAQGKRAYRVVQLSRFLFFFRGHGMELDHLYARHGTQAFLIELTRGGFIWTDRKSFKNFFRWYNPVDPAHHTEQGLRAIEVLIRSWGESPQASEKE